MKIIVPTSDTEKKNLNVLASFLYIYFLKKIIYLIEHF